MSKYNTLWEYVQKISIKNQTDMFEKMGDKAKVLEKGEFTNYSRACLKTHSYILHAPICSFQTHPSMEPPVCPTLIPRLPMKLSIF